PITWKGEWQGKTYEDKGTVLAVEPNKLLRITHWSPMGGSEDKPENYHTVTYELAERGARPRSPSGKTTMRARKKRTRWQRRTGARFSRDSKRWLRRKAELSPAPRGRISRVTSSAVGAQHLRDLARLRRVRD